MGRTYIDFDNILYMCVDTHKDLERIRESHSEAYLDLMNTHHTACHHCLNERT